MADQDDTIEFDVDIDLSDSLKAVAQLAQRLKSFEGDLVGSVGMVQQQMRKAANEYAAYIKRLEGDLKRVKAEGGDTSKHQMALAQVRSRQQSSSDAVRSRTAGGDEFTRSSRAVVDGQIAAMRGETRSLMNRLTKEVLGEALDSIRLTRQQVEARIKEEGLKAARLRDRTTDPMIRARQADASFRDSEFLKDVGAQATTGRRNDNRRTIQQIGDQFEVYQAKIAQEVYRSTQLLLDSSEAELSKRAQRAALRRNRGSLLNPEVEDILARRQSDDRIYRATNGESARQRAARKQLEAMDKAEAQAAKDADKAAREAEKLAARQAKFDATFIERTFRDKQKLLDQTDDQMRVRGEKADLRRYRNQSFDGGDERRLSDRAAEDRSYRAKNGDAAAGLRKTRERMNLNGGADMLGVQASVLGNYALLGGSLGAVGFLGNFIVELDSELKNFQAITATTNSEMDGMKTRMLDVAEATKFSAVEIAQAATLMGQAGLSASQVSSALEPVALLATAAGTDLKSAVDVVTSTLNIFNLQTSEGAHIADVYTAALNQSKLTLDQLTLSLQYAGNTAATAGVGYNELTAAIGAMANAGIRSGSTLGTGIRQLLVDLMNPSKKLTAELQNVGLTLNDVNVEANGLTGVITNLQEAGFGTANAFNAFEVRAAAAFTALASNVDTISTLRQSFLLTTAATEANAIQMESLAASWSRFGDNAGSVAYTAFEPTKDFLQDILVTLSELLGVAGDNDVVLKLLGSTVASLASAWALVKVGSLVLGFTRLAIAARGATTAVGTLSAIVGLSPIGLAISLATAGAIALTAMANSASAAADKIDKLDAKINDTNGVISENQSRIQSLTDTIDDLTKKRANLEKVGNEGLRVTRIMEVVNTFGELAGTIDTSTASVGDLISALQGLKGELSSDLPAQFGLVIENLGLKIDELKRITLDYQKVAGKEGAGSFAGGLYGDSLNSEDANSLNRGTYDLTKFSPRIAQDFGTDVATAFTALVTNQDLDGQLAKSLRDNLEKVILETTRKIGNLEYLEDPSASQSAELDQLQLKLEKLKELGEAFTPFANNMINLAASEKQVELNQMERRKALVAQKTGGIDAEVTNLGSFVRNGLAAITEDQGANGKGLDVQVVAQRLKELDDAFNARLAKIDEAAAEVAKQLVASGEMTETQANNLMRAAPFRSEIEEIRNPLRAEGTSAKEQLKKIDGYLKERDQKSLERQIDAQMTALSKATNDQEVDVIKGYIKSLEAQLKSVTTELSELVVDKDIAASPGAQAVARQQLLDAADDAAAERDKLILERRAAIYKDEQDQREGQLQTELNGITNEMRLLLDQMNDASSVELITAIRKKLDELAARAKTLAGQIANMDVGSDFIPVSGASGTAAANMRGGTPPTATGGNVRDQVWNFFAGKGLQSHQIAGIMGNVGQESTFNPLAQGDRDKSGTPQAFGLFQHNDRKNKLFDFIGGKQNLGDVQKQLEFAWHELQTTEAASLKKLLASGNVQESTEAFLGFERPSGYNTGVKNSHGYSSRVSAAEEAFRRYGGGGAAPVAEQRQTAIDAKAGDLSRDSDKIVQDAAQRAKKAQARELYKSFSAEADALTAEVNTLMTQSGKVSDPQALESILGQVKGKWSQIMEKEVAAFTAKNEGADDFKEQLASFRKTIDAKLNQDVVQLLDKYQAAIENQVPEGLKIARAQLDAAQAPEAEGKFTALQVQELQNNVTLQERIALTTQLNALEQFRTLITDELTTAEAQYGVNSEQANALRARAAEVEKSVGDMRIATTAQTEAAARSEVTFADAIQNANNAWAQRNGLMNSSNEMISLAEQTGEAWGQVLDGLTSGFSTLFSDLAKGSMTAEEAFKNFALSTIDMFIQLIAKALAYQLIQSTLGGIGGEASGGIGSFLSGLVGVTGSADGEIVPGAEGNRDSVLRKVMPGEAILRASAVNAIGRDKLTEVNALGNRTLSEGAKTLDAQPTGEGTTTNVWVVLPEEQTQMGPQDVVAIISDDMRNRGMTRQLVKSIASGRV